METFQILEVLVSDTDRKGLWPEEKQQGIIPSLAMVLFGRTLSGQSVLVAIRGLRATLHVRLSPAQRPAGRGVDKLPYALQDTYHQIQQAVSDLRDVIVTYEAAIPFGEYGDGQTELFFKMDAPTNFVGYLAKDAVLGLGLGFEIVAPGRVFLRETVLFHDFGWEFSSLLALTDVPPKCRPGGHRRIGQCDLEYWLDAEQVLSGMLQPAENQLATAPLIIASVDIEVKAPGGGFPDASKPEDEIVCIGVHSTVLGGKDADTVLCLDPDSKGWGTGPVGTFKCYRTERALLEGYAALVQTLDVDVFIGYNLLGFDDQYIWDRAMQVGANGMTRYGRLRGLETELKEITLSSSALGDNVFHEIRAIGRLTVDMLHWIKPNYKLASYSLNAVSAALLGEDECKNDMHYSMITTYAGGDDNETLAARCEDDPALLRLMRQLPAAEHAIVHQRLSPAAREADLRNMASELWTEHRIQVLALLANELQVEPTAGVDRRMLLADYCRQDCVLPMRLMRKTGAIEGLIAMSRVTHTSMYNLLRRGQQIKVFSSLYRATRDEGIIMTQPPGHYCPLQGATVLDPIRGVHTTPVGTLDFASLYPNCFRWGNLCYSTYLGTRDVTEPPPDMPEEDRRDIQVAPRTIVSFVRPSVRKGILPKVVGELLAARKRTRRRMKDLEAGSSEWVNLEKRQLAIKVSANSMYGVLGVGDGAYSLSPVAAATTALGRLALAITQRMCRTQFADMVSRIIYGDTGVSAAQRTLTVWCRLGDGGAQSAGGRVARRDAAEGRRARGDPATPHPWDRGGVRAGTAP